MKQARRLGQKVRLVNPSWWTSQNKSQCKFKQIYLTYWTAAHCK